MLYLIELALGLLCVLCTVVILVDAFKNSVVKGFVCLLCGLYYIYYALFEFSSPNKVFIVIGSLLSGGVAGAMHWARR